MYPNIDSKSESGQLVQIRSYLHQLVEQLNFALGNVDSQPSQSMSGVGLRNVSSAVIGSANTAQQDTSKFNSIKGLIIKNAEIVDALYQEVTDRLSGKYVAQSEFGEYKQETDAAFRKTSLGLEIVLSENQSVESVEYSVLRSSNAWIKTGKIGEENGWPVYGMEIWQYGTQVSDDGSYSEERCARYTSGGVELYGEDSDNPVARIIGDTIEITHAYIKKSLKLGGYLIDVERFNGILFKPLKEE